MPESASLRLFLVFPLFLLKVQSDGLLPPIALEGAPVAERFVPRYHSIGSEWHGDETGARRGELLKLKTTDIVEKDESFYVILRRMPDDPSNNLAFP